MSEDYGIDQPEDLDYTAAVLQSVFQNRNRLYTFMELYDGKEPKHIAHDLDVTRNALQHYIDDWKENDLVYTEGKDYEFTDTAEVVVNAVEEFEGLFDDPSSGWMKWDRENQEPTDPDF